jgi:GAF domain
MRRSLVRDNRGVNPGDEAAVAALREQTTLPGLLHTSTREFVDAVDGVAAAISRRVGNVLIQVAEHARDGRTLVLGHGYLITDFPLTKRVLDDDDPALCSLLEDDCEPTEAALLKELGLDSLLMLPLRMPGGVWGLAEVYVNGRAFTDEDVERAEPIARAFGELVEQMPAPAR